MGKKPKLILIDLDDTLWATQRNNKRGLQALYTALEWGQYFVSFDEFFALYEPINHALWSEYNVGAISKEALSVERLRRPLEGKLEQSMQAWQRADELFISLVKEQTELCPHALEVMAELKQRYPIAILSNGFGSLQHTKVERSGLTPYVDQVILSDELGINKPDPRIFQHALSLMGNVQAEDAVMIGDSYHSDIIGASNAGIPSIWYNPQGWWADESVSITAPIATITDLRALLTLL